MVDKINSQNSWRQITSPGRVKKVKQRPDFNRDKRFKPGDHKDGYKSKKRSGQSSSADSSPDSDRNGSKQKSGEELSAESADKKKERDGKAQGKLIDIVV